MKGFKRLLLVTLLILACSVFFFACGDDDGGGNNPGGDPPKVTIIDITIDASSVKTEYFTGESLNLDGLVVKVIKSDNSEVILKADKFLEYHRMPNATDRIIKPE